MYQIMMLLYRFMVIIRWKMALM